MNRWVGENASPCGLSSPLASTVGSASTGAPGLMTTTWPLTVSETMRSPLGAKAMKRAPGTFVDTIVTLKFAGAVSAIGGTPLDPGGAGPVGPGIDDEVHAAMNEAKMRAV